MSCRTPLGLLLGVHCSSTSPHPTLLLPTHHTGLIPSRAPQPNCQHLLSTLLFMPWEPVNLDADLDQTICSAQDKGDRTASRKTGIYQVPSDISFIVANEEIFKQFSLKAPQGFSWVASRGLYSEWARHGLSLSLFSPGSFALVQLGCLHPILLEEKLLLLKHH